MGRTTYVRHEPPEGCCGFPCACRHCSRMVDERQPCVQPNTKISDSAFDGDMAALNVEIRFAVGFLVGEDHTL